MSIIGGAKTRWREWREAAAARKAAQVSDPPNVTVPAWLVRAAYFASWVATCSLIYFLWLYTLDIARDRSGPLHLTRAGTWEGDVSFWFPYIFGFAIVAFGVPYTAKIAVPTFMSLSWRGGFWPKLWALIIALCVSMVVIAGSFTVMGHTLMERDRESLVAVEQVQNSRAALEAQIESRRQELSEMMNNRNAYLAQAASVGAEEWERSYVAQARATNDPRLPMLERAIGAARSADNLRAELVTLRTQLAQSQTVASVQGQVITERTSWIADTLGWLEGVRAILLSLVMDIVALMMPWIALRLEQARNRQMGLAEGIPKHRWMIEDKSTADKPGYMSPEEVREKSVPLDGKYQGDTIYDEAGKELKWVEGFVRKKDGKWIPGHYRPTGVRRKQEIEVTVGGKTFTTDIVADDKPATEDGGARIAMSAGGPVSVEGHIPNLASPEHESAQQENDAQQSDKPQSEQQESVEYQQSDVVQPEPPELSDEEALALADELAAEESQQQPDETPAQPEPEARVEQADEDADHRREPETNPGRMIAAE